MVQKVLVFIALISLFLLPVLIAHGQVRDGHTSLVTGIASPTAASLGKYGDIPVSEFTGAPNINIPLFDLKGRTLTLPVSLSYNSSGIKVGEIAGWAGQGWSLNAGGVITRTLRGLPDDHVYNIGYLGAGGDSAEVYIQNDGTVSAQDTSYLGKVFRHQLDGEPDQFFFNFAGRSGRIFFARDDTAQPYHYTPYTSPQQDIRVKTQVDNYRKITAWILTAEDGTMYTFSEQEKTTTPFSYTSSWYLTSIKPATGNDVINLTYQTGGYVKVDQPRESEFSMLEYGHPVCVPQNYYSHFSSSTATVYLWKITAAGQTATFYRGSRSDGGGMRVDSIVVTNTATSTPVRSYKLVHGYFNAGGTSKEQRLRLDGLRQFSSDGAEDPGWSFEYDTSYPLPARDSNARDYWGYYNHKTTNKSLVPRVKYNGTYYGSSSRDPSSTYVKAGVLTGITWPTGGQSTLTWEANRYGASNTIGGGVRIRRIEHENGIDPAHNLVLTYQYSAGILLRHPQLYYVQDYIRDTKSNGLVRCHYLVRSSTSYIAPGMMDGSVIRYPQVTILKGKNGEGGKTVKYFKVPSEINYNNGKWPHVPTVTDYWRGEGKLTGSEVLTASGQMSGSVTYYYETSDNRPSVWGVVVGGRYVQENLTTPPQVHWQYVPRAYMVNNGAYYLAWETRKEYGTTGTASVSINTTYERNNLPDFVQVTGKTETNSDGQVRKTSYEYAWEVTNDGSVGTGLNYTPMKALHMLSQPYSVTVEDNSGNILSKRWTLWSDSTGFWRPRGEWIWTGGSVDTPIFRN